MTGCCDAESWAWIVQSSEFSMNFCNSLERATRFWDFSLHCNSSLSYYICTIIKKQHMWLKFHQTLHFSICYKKVGAKVRIFYIPWTARERSMSVTLLKEAAWSCFFLLFLEALLRLRLALESPHMLVPPCVDGIFKKVMPCKGGPSLRFNDTPSHCKMKMKNF